MTLDEINAMIENKLNAINENNHNKEIDDIERWLCDGLSIEDSKHWCHLRNNVTTEIAYLKHYNQRFIKEPSNIDMDSRNDGIVNRAKNNLRVAFHNFFNSKMEDGDEELINKLMNSDYI